MPGLSWSLPPNNIGPYFDSSFHNDRDASMWLPDFLKDDPWKVVEAIATALTAGFAFWQVLSIRIENRKTATLAACEKYDNDPVFDNYLRELSANRPDVTVNPLKYRLAISTILNYLDGIAIGVAQGLYLDNLAKDHLEDIVKTYVGDYLLDTSKANAMAIAQQDYRHLLALYARWFKPTVAYKPWWKWR
jgi:hypothetical protein